MATTLESSSFVAGHETAPVVLKLKIACIYRLDHVYAPKMANMAPIRLYRMAAALARRGHEVDIVVSHHRERRVLAPRLCEVSSNLVRWNDYQVVKTSFHRGFESLCELGGGDHPFIISKLGSMVGSGPAEGVHFFGAEREQLFKTQQEIARKSRLVTILTQRSIDLWRREHGPQPPVLMVPTGVDAEIPPIRSNPYLGLGIEGPVALFAGHLYSERSQQSVNVMWTDALNRLGAKLRRHGIHLVAMGSGRAEHLDREAVVFVGTMEVDEVWDWQRHAQVGIVLAQGDVQNNESSKIYYYLRTGLPVVCERSVPNASLIEQTGMGTLVDFGNLDGFADAIREVVRHRPINHRIESYMVEHHSWDARAALYDPVFAAITRNDVR
ncbi:MAG TPA: glycosyltransferase [Candidatus Binataceae bacterium]|nr:glycosyltransferase [Candidatus Binataceae bacterium]